MVPSASRRERRGDVTNTLGPRDYRIVMREKSSFHERTETTVLAHTDPLSKGTIEVERLFPWHKFCSESISNEKLSCVKRPICWPSTLKTRHVKDTKGPAPTTSLYLEEIPGAPSERQVKLRKRRLKRLKLTRIQLLAHSVSSVRATN